MINVSFQCTTGELSAIQEGLFQYRKMKQLELENTSERDISYKYMKKHLDEIESALKIFKGE